MDMDTYTSQEALIVAKAKEKGIDTAELNAVFERRLRRVTAEFGGDGGSGNGRSVAWRLARVEEAVWEWFCKFTVVFEGKRGRGRVREARCKGWAREKGQSRQCVFKKRLADFDAVTSSR